MDASEQNLYDTLGVDENASAANITAAYRRLSRTYHPDRWLEPEEKREASKRWLGISAAYDVLADDRKRMTYDTLGPDQFALGLQVLNDTVRGPDDLRRAVQKVKRRSAEQDYPCNRPLQNIDVHWFSWCFVTCFITCWFFVF